MTAVAIIPARGGSRRIPRKNIRPFNGKPIIAYSIEAALDSRLFDDVYVSTEDLEIAEVARQFGAKWLQRPDDLAEVNGAPDPGTQEVTCHALVQLGTLGIRPDAACCIYATAPLMSVRDLVMGFKVLERNPKAAFALAWGAEADAGQFYWGWSRAFLSRLPLSPLADYVWKIGIPSERVCDINVEADWERAERMFFNLEENRIAYG